MEEGKNQIRKISQTRLEGKKYRSSPHKLTLPTLCSSPKLPGLQKHFQLPIPWHTFCRFSLHNLFLKNQDFLPWQGRGVSMNYLTMSVNLQELHAKLHTHVWTSFLRNESTDFIRFSKRAATQNI